MPWSFHSHTLASNFCSRPSPEGHREPCKPPLFYSFPGNYSRCCLRSTTKPTFVVNAATETCDRKRIGVLSREGDWYSPCDAFEERGASVTVLQTSIAKYCDSGATTYNQASLVLSLPL